ncbi:hypothetical protein Bbelb_400350 [Branchiostoma belcheri]|nr:hypothetical protein Bbelb_400350 [Branchiostoma belcheri]
MGKVREEVEQINGGIDEQHRLAQSREKRRNRPTAASNGRARRLTSPTLTGKKKLNKHIPESPSWKDDDSIPQLLPRTCDRWSHRTDASISPPYRDTHLCGVSTECAGVKLY